MRLIDFQQIVGQIQSILTSDNDPPEDRLRELAAQYVEAVNLINRRLTECDDYLHRGLRAEALQVADVEPNLLDAFAVLDFPELPAWNDYIGQFAIEAAPQLRLDSAAELNEAYSAAEPLEKLLQKHRRLALARASLAERTQTLRDLARLDDNNRIWQEDLTVYEQHRLSQMQKECERAVRQSDFGRLALLEQELHETPWCVEIPQNIRGRIRREHDRLRAAAAYEELKQLALQLSDAYSALDLRDGRALYARWNAVQRIAQPADSDEVFDLAGPALDWLQQEAEREQLEADYRSAVQTLEALLDEPCDRETLNRSYQRARGFDRELSPVLEHRVVERFKELELRAKQKNRLIVFCVVSTFLITGALVTFLVQRHVYAQEVARHAEQFQSLIESGNLADARGYLETIEKTQPHVALEPEINGLAAKLRDAERTEDGRLQQFEQLISAADDILLEQPSWDDFDAASGHLQQAEQIARSGEEKSRVKKIEREVAQSRRDMQSQIDTQFQTDLDDVKLAITRLNGNSVDPYADVLKRLIELKSRPHVGPVFMTPVAGMIAKVEQEQAATARRMSLLADLQRVTDSLGNARRYNDALKEFARRNQGTTRAANFDRLLSEEADLWAGVEQWNTLRSRWKLASLRLMSPTQAADLLSQYDEFQKSSGPYPGAMEISRRLEVARAVSQRRNASKSGVLDLLEKQLDSKAIKDVLAVPDATGTWYTDEVPVISGKNLTVKYFVNLSFGQKNTTTIASSGVPRASERLTRSDWASPQTRFATAARTTIAQMGTVPWEESFEKLTDMLLAESEMDHVLQVTLLEMLLQRGAEGSVFLQETLKSPLLTCVSGRPNSVNWVLPGDSDARDERVKARTVLARLKSLSSHFEAAKTLRDEAAKQSLGPALHWVGWLYHEPPRPGEDPDVAPWKCAVSDQLTGRHAGKLMVVFRKNESSSTPAITQIGMLDGGVAELDRSLFPGSSPPPSLLIEGRPVYVEVFN